MYLIQVLKYIRSILNNDGHGLFSICGKFAFAYMDKVDLFLETMEISI